MDTKPCPDCGGVMEAQEYHLDQCGESELPAVTFACMCGRTETLATGERWRAIAIIKKETIHDSAVKAPIEIPVVG